MKLEGKSLKSDFLRFILPSIAAQWVFSLYSMVDGIFVAKGVSEVALTAVNISAPFMIGMFSVSILFAVGTSTVVAILLGQNKKRQANAVFTQNVVVASLMSILITVLVVWKAEPFARFLGATDATLPYVKEYVTTLAVFAFAFVLSYSFETLIKTDGYPRLAIIAVITGAVLNCILDYITVMVLGWGVFGAAASTGVAQTVVLLLYLKHFLGKHGTIKFTRFKWDFPLIGREIRNGLSSGITELSAGITIFLFNQAILHYLNEEALVSYTVISYVNSIVVMSMVGIAQGFQPLVSYYHGQGRTERCRKLLKYGLLSTLVLSVCTAFVCYIGTDFLTALFISADLPALRADTVTVFRIFSLSFLLCGYNIVVSGYFTAVERPAFATTISLARGFVTLALSLLVLTLLFGGQGIWWAATLSEGICLILSLTFMWLSVRQKASTKATRHLGQRSLAAGNSLNG